MQFVSPQDLSILVTTSPIRSHPDTQVIDDSINSILSQPTLQKVHIYIICDGAKINQQNKYKSGIITQQTYQNYLKYKQRLHEKYTKPSPHKYTIIQRQHRYGFAQNIKYAMQKHITTDLVMIYQHDHVIEQIVDFPTVISTMKKYKKQINYLTFMHKSYKTLIARMVNYSNIKQYLTKLLQKDQDYNISIHMEQFTQQFIQYFDKKYGLPLIPLNFWYDKVHIASRKYYLDVIFNEKGSYDPNRGKFMKTVSFPQDTFGHCMKNSIIEKPQLLLQYGAYILWGQKQVFFHQSGRAFMCEQQRQQLLKNGKNTTQAQKLQQSQSNSQNQDVDLSKLMLQEQQK